MDSENSSTEQPANASREYFAEHSFGPRGVIDLHGVRRSRYIEVDKQARRRMHLATGRRRRNELLMVFCHEVRSSLGAIRNAGQLLRMQCGETPSGKQARLLIERQVGRVTRLLDDLVDVSRTSGAESTLRLDRLDLRVVANQAIETVQSDFTARNHTLTTSFSDMPLWVKGDSGRLEQVLVNLLGNAAKYTNDGGKISLSIHHRDNEVIMCIRDSGIGIDPDVLPCVFNLFMQADHSSRRAEAGFGIGLALVRRHVELHGGTVTAASEGLGRGSAFVVCLPMVV